MELQRKRRKPGYMYTPFGGSQALDSALGENMARLTAGKPVRGLLAPSHIHADELEQLRQERLGRLKTTIERSEGRLGVFEQYEKKMAAQFIVDVWRAKKNPSSVGATLQRHKAFSDYRGKRERFEDRFGTDKLIEQSTLAMNKPMYQALEATRVLNTSPQLYPSLYPNPPLQFLHPETQYSRGDKLYVLGHGAPGSDRIYARNDSPGPSLSARELEKHLRQAGMPKQGIDLRLTSCQGVPALPDMNKAVKNTLNSGFLVPELAKRMGAKGYSGTVTGYMGNGVTFPYDSPFHLRSAPEDDNLQGQRSLVAVKYPLTSIPKIQSSFSIYDSRSAFAQNLRKAYSNKI